MEKKNILLGMLAGILGLAAYASQAAAGICGCTQNSTSWGATNSLPCNTSTCAACPGSSISGTSRGAVSSGHNVILASLDSFTMGSASCDGLASAQGLDSAGHAITGCVTPVDTTVDGNSVAGPASGTPCDAAAKTQAFVRVQTHLH